MAYPIGITGILFGTPPQIRTETERGLNPMPLPIGLVAHDLAKVARIELTSTGLEAVVLPLNYTLIIEFWSPR